MQRSRLPLILGIAGVVLAVVAISIIAVRSTYPQAPSGTTASSLASPGASPGPTPAPVPSPTVDPAIAWADQVCAAAQPITDTVAAVSEDLVVPAPGGLDEVRSRLRARADLVIEQLEPLTVALGQVPIDVPEAVTLANELTGEVDTLKAESTALRQSIDALTQADGVVAFGMAIPDAVSAAGRAAEATGALGATIRDTLSAQGARLGDAFAASDACRALSGTDSA